MDRREIQKKIKLFEPFTRMTCELIKALLDAKSIKYHIVESRTKKIDSLEEKIERKEIKSLENEITDVTGIRIILYYQDDIDKVEELIKTNFIIDADNSVNKEKLYQSNEFGYLSRHYIVQVNKARSALLEWKNYSELKAEIQIRTVLQHSWASISHELSYKKNYDIPKELSRKLFRLAGLFELADEQFLSIRNKHEALKEEIENLGNDELVDKGINMLTLKNNLKVYDDLTNLAKKSGFKINPPSRGDKYLSGIKLAANLLGINSIGELEKTLLDGIGKSELLYKKLIEKSPSIWGGDKTFFMLLAVLQNLNEKQIDGFSEQFGWDNKLWNRTVTSINEINS